ncbi:hypothetical protein FA13DRAFT_1779267 [Coprinellus micaceus]|uniref:HNH nuclease domain-containing protein n=1 Tax=Coprinellus micaceus TaxID=71717 RepID=A0A4Y7SHP3_COPMI|nr:hypothetical protein FA13DRAFT_1779267 [Coprinellus micaceus]
MVPYVGETPLSRAQRVGVTEIPKISKEAKLRALARSPTGDRCLIENFPFTRGGNVCHVFPRRMSTDDTTMSAIEYHTGMKVWTMNVDSSANIFHASATMHKLFDDGHIAFLPMSPNVIGEFLGSDEFPTRGNFPSYPDSPDGKAPEFQYALIPLNVNMEPIVIFREDLAKQGKEQHSIYRYPFTDFPIITSNIQPHFVLLSLGRQLSKLGEDKVEALGSFTRGGVDYTYAKVRDFWMHSARIPDEWEDDMTFHVPGDPIQAPYFSDEESDEPDDTTKDKSYYGGASSKTVPLRIQRQRRVKHEAKSRSSVREEPRTPSKSSSKKSKGGMLGQKPRNKEKSNPRREIRPLPRGRNSVGTAAAGNSGGSDAVAGGSSTTM